ncbi:YkgJ family cysteine cluster protein [Chloroflexota bacterium]
MSVVQWLDEDVTAQIDCTTCANCCQVLAPSLNQDDLQRLARALDLDVTTLQTTYL